MKKIVLFWGAATLLVACTAQLDQPVETIDNPVIAEEQAPVLYASISEEAQTKVYLDEDYKVLWTADDRISVFNKNTYNQQYSFDGATGDNAGTFSIVEDGKLKVSNDIDNLYAVYPYNESTSISNTGVLTVNFPAAQTYSATTFGQGSNTMVAVTDGTNIQFKNACGYLMFKLYGTSVSVKTISLKGNNNEKIAGEATVSMSLGGTPTVAMSGSATDEIILTCTDAVAIGNASSDYTEFWFAVPPVTFSSGFTITVTDNTGKVFTKSTSSSLEIVRSYAKKMAPIQVTPVPDYLCLTAVGDGKVRLSLYGSCSPSLEYSRDLVAWYSWDYSNIDVADGNSVYFRGNNSSAGISKDIWGNHAQFAFTGTFEASGSVQSLIYGSECGSNLTIPTSACFFRLFYNCAGLTKAPSLPATSLTTDCYRAMFSGCTGLTSAPKLPALTLAESCYDSMFTNCSNLASAPELPAMSLARLCYESMFKRCTSLTTTPALPASTLAEGCYLEMFYECSGLLEAKPLNATNLAADCYNSMFRGCTNLTTVPTTLPAPTLASQCYTNMFMYCEKLATAPILPALTLVSGCYSQMFYGCSSLNYVKALFTTTISGSTYYTYNWLSGVAADGTFVKNAVATWDLTGANGVPSGWTVETADN